MAEPIYCIKFLNNGQVFELFAKNVYQSEMYGFIEIESLIFNEKTKVLVDPSEERLKNEFANVERSYIPMHSIIRIDEVNKVGPSKISDFKGGGTIAHFPPAGQPKSNKD